MEARAIPRDQESDRMMEDFMFAGSKATRKSVRFALAHVALLTLCFAVSN